MKRLHSARMWGVIIILQKRANSAHRAACAEPDQNSQRAAMLRGKAKGYQEAVDLLKRLDKGWKLPPKRKDTPGVRFVRDNGNRKTGQIESLRSVSAPLPSTPLPEEV